MTLLLDALYQPQKLQWGRRSSPAEGAQGGLRRERGLLRASMGPPVFTGGGLGVDVGRVLQHRASMGPPVFTGGGWRAPVTAMWLAMLQWGRRSSPAEGASPSLLPLTVVVLQWGRRSSPAEGVASAHARTSAATLQWGRRSSPAEGRAARSTGWGPGWPSKSADLSNTLPGPRAPSPAGAPPYTTTAPRSGAS